MGLIAGGYMLPSRHMVGFNPCSRDNLPSKQHTHAPQQDAKRPHIGCGGEQALPQQLGRLVGDCSSEG